jgi:uncharacterized protein YjdB
MKKIITSITIVLLFICSSLSAATYYVSASGNDGNAGTSLASPFATIQHAVNVMDPGDICYIRGGAYHEEVDLSGVAGSEGQPITLTNYEGEKVILDGRVKVETAWKLEDRDSVSLPTGNNTPRANIPGIGNVYVTTLPDSIGDITQVFVDDKSMTLARWPNALAYSDGVFIRGKTQTQKSSATHGEATDLANPFSLASTGVSVTGCVGLFGSARLITAHNAGSADFSHNPPIRLESGKNNYFIEGGKDNAERVLLDAQQEWAYDESTRKLTLWPENDQDPNGLNIYARNLSDAFKGDANTKYVVIDGLDFFAMKFDFNYSDNITIQNCDLTYYSISERALGGEELSKTTDFTGSSTDFCENIKVFNCAFRYADGTGFNANYIDKLTFENNLIYKVGYYTCNEWDEYGQRRNTHAFHAYNSKDIHYCRNTVNTTGTSQSVCFGRYGTGSPEYPIVAEYNLNTKCCGLMTDVASMYMAEEDVHESVARYNWFIDNYRRDFRWDGANINEVLTAKGNFYRNVGKEGLYAKHGFRLKGDFHEIYNSITVGDTWTFDIAEGKGGNANTVSRNNAADAWSTILSEDGYNWDLPGDDANNYRPGSYGGTKSMHQLLRDPDNWDFRPRADAIELIDQGTPVICTVNGVEIDVTEGYLGKAPDVGAYEFGDSTYWIGGRQEAQASMPVPMNNGVNVLTDADLMYLIGLDGVKAHIYMGTSEDNLSLVTTKNDPYNIVDLSNGFALEQNQTYYWRVDTELADGTVVTGDVWSFTTGEKSSETSIPGVSIVTTSAIAKLYAGDTLQLSAIVNPPELVSQGVIWKSSDTSVATIDSTGFVTALTAGEVIITVTTANGIYTDKTLIIVLEPVTGVSLTPDSVQISRGETQQLSATVFPEDATEKSVSYSISDASIATVSSSGQVTAINMGVTTITVTTQDGAYTDKCEVTVVPIETSNLALNGTATQSSIDYEGVPSRAIDGNTSGIWADGSITHTLEESNPWWEVDLDKEYYIGSINIYNRSGKTKTRLSNFTVLVYSADSVLVYSETFTTYPDPSVTVVLDSVLGQRIKVQLNGTGILSLAEVQVFEYGSDGTPVNEAIALKDVIVFPNPAQEYLRVSNLPVGASIKLVNTMGSVLASFTSDRKFLSISTSGIHSGMYMLHIDDGRTLKIIKLIVNK